MPAAYPPDFTRQMVELCRSARPIRGLAEELEPSQADPPDPPRTADREDFAKLPRENHHPRQERDILAKAGGQACKGQDPDGIFQFLSAKQASSHPHHGPSRLHFETGPGAARQLQTDACNGHLC